MSKTTHTAARAADMYYTQPQTVSRCLAHLRESLATVKNENLKASLEKLGRGILTKDEK